MGNWQTVLTVLIVAVAASWLIRRLVRLLSGNARGGCHSGHCSAASETGLTQQPLVSLDVPEQPTDKK